MNFFCLMPLMFVLSTFSYAHEVRPAYLELRQTDATTFDVLWKVPGQGKDLRLSLDVEFPPDTVLLSQPRGEFLNQAFIQRWTVKNPVAFVGETLRIAGLSATLTDVILRVERLGGKIEMSRLTPASPSIVLEGVPNRWKYAQTYFLLGNEHILFGFDHLLFVLALILLVSSSYALLKTVTAFTLAHSITLALTTLGFLRLAQPPVEACIALSVMLLAGEIGHQARYGDSLVRRCPWIVAFLFGLLHGAGFASALSEFGLPQGEVPLALLTFNLGVESGQLTFIAIVLALRTLAKRIGVQERIARFVLVGTKYGIGISAAFWFFQRVAQF